jgi:hypothetical protein
MMSIEGETMRSWTWIGRYALVLVAAVLLGAAIGELAVFKQTTLGTPKLPASSLARFVGYGGALVVFALLGQRMASQFRRSGNGTAHLSFLLLPLTVLTVLSAGYDIALAVLHPFLSASQKNIYNWLFVFGISAASVWLVVALYRHAEGLVALLQAVRLYTRRPARCCASCDAALPEHAKFCCACGAEAGA